MSLARGRRARPETNYWPGFVDAMATLLLVVTFLLSVFMVVQFMVTQIASRKDTALQRLNKQIAQLTELLALESSTKITLEDTLSSLRVTIKDKTVENTRLQSFLTVEGEKAKQSAGRAGSLASEIEEQMNLSAQALAQVELLNQQLAALRRQIASLEEVLDASESDADLGSRAQAQSGPGSKSAGACPLPVGFLWPAALDTGVARRCAHPGRPVRVSGRGAVPIQFRCDEY
jgi:chemotaxis protein MotB